MKRKLILLNLALLVPLAGLGWRLRQEWHDAKLREVRVLDQKVPPVKVVPPRPNPPAPPLSSAGYLDVADKMLFSKDRNPTVVIEPETPKPEPPMPDLPYAYGVMTLGEPTVILADRGKGQHIYRVGDMVGDFKLMSVDSTNIVFEWNGKKVERKLTDLIPRPGAPGASGASGGASSSAGPAAAEVSSAPVAAEPAKPPATVESPFLSSSGTALGPGPDIGSGYRSCQQGDSTPAGTIVDGVRKQMYQTPMAKTCIWEPVGPIR